MPKPKTTRQTVRRKPGTFDEVMAKLLERVGLGARLAKGESLIDLAGALLSLRGRASGPALASALFDRYEASDLAARRAFLGELHAAFPRDADAIDAAAAQWQSRRDEASAAALAQAAESPCLRLVQMLNLAPGGTQRLLAMRVDLLGAGVKDAGLRALDSAFEDAFAEWFNAGFLELRRIDWASPAAVLERIIAYEAVHSIAGWDDLRRRVAPTDRRCYAFFHPQMHDDPLIFVEVALTAALPSAIAGIIADDRLAVDPHGSGCAIFYSISNCQEGLRGIPFGNFLIKQVVGLLSRELPQLRRFATLSPVPGFAGWLAEQEDATALADPAALRRACARYITTARDKRGQVRDTVARFHLGNGARLEAVHSRADLSDKGQRQSHGVMVNYLYDLAEIEANHMRLFEMDTVATSPAVLELLQPAPARGLVEALGLRRNTRSH